MHSSVGCYAYNGKMVEKMQLKKTTFDVMVEAIVSDKQH
jgi:hypothetical protein